MSRSLSKRDLDEIIRHGISVVEAERQLGVLRQPPRFVVLDRPCLAGDGLRVLDPKEIDAYVAAFEQASRRRRLVKFVPASGAATRMFKTAESFRRRTLPVTRQQLRTQASEGASDAAELLASVENIHRFAFCPALRLVLRQRGCDLDHMVEHGDVREALEALLGTPGLSYASLPKALLRFHAYPEGTRTAFEEHLVEAADYLCDRSGTCRLHFTVSPEHRLLFDELLAAVRAGYEHAYGVTFEVGFSMQKPSTDSIALTPEGAVFRTSTDEVLFRPGGHGALIENLQDLAGDIVLIKNVDNVVPDHFKRPTYLWKRVLVGMAVALQDQAFTKLAALMAVPQEAGAIDDALVFLRDALNMEIPDEISRADIVARRAFACSRLDRPLRVCGMVRNQGEPGGGPFWVRSEHGASVQIVESSQIDPDRADQHRVFSSATHFNPVDLVCAVRDSHGAPYDLSRFIDPSTSFIVEKSSEGRPLRSLERPGLWNGAMAFWNSVFVEVPADTFHPVKVLNDLLRPAHQPLGSAA